MIRVLKRKCHLKLYNIVGYACILTYAAACIYFAPAHLGPWTSLAIGIAYLTVCWFSGGLYLSSIIHMGIAHRALDYQEWFIKTVTVFNNTFGVYVNPVTWVNRHRLHHKFADHPGDPNKLSADGFWRTMYLCMFPYETGMNVATDTILKTLTFRIVANPVFDVASQVFQLSLLWFLLGDLRFAATLWVGTRIFALWVNMIQNYWTHDRRFGYRRYDDADDNAMNIGDWLPVTATFSACLQNNHHHSPRLLRLSHEESEYDFGFMTVKAMKALGLVRATSAGENLPGDVPLKALNF